MFKKLSSCKFLLLVLCGLFLSSVSSAENASRLFINRLLNEHVSESMQSIQRIASGRILLADNPANFAIYELLEKQIRQLDKQIDNGWDMVFYYRYQDGLLANLSTSLQRIRELAVQRLNGILDESDREIIDSEINQHYDQISYDLSQAEYNKVRVFTTVLESPAAKAALHDLRHKDLAQIDQLMQWLLSERVRVGTQASTMEFSLAGMGIQKENTQAFQGEAGIRFGQEINVFRQHQILMMANILMLSD